MCSSLFILSSLVFLTLARPLPAKTFQAGAPSGQESSNADGRWTPPPLVSDDEQDLGPSARAFRYASSGFQAQRGAVHGLGLQILSSPHSHALSDSQARPGSPNVSQGSQAPLDSPQTSQSETFSSKTPSSPVQAQWTVASGTSSPLSDPPQSPPGLSQASLVPGGRAARRDSRRHSVKSELRPSPYRIVSRKSPKVGVLSRKASNNANGRWTLPPLNFDDEQDLGPSAQAFRHALSGFQPQLDAPHAPQPNPLRAPGGLGLKRSSSPHLSDSQTQPGSPNVLQGSRAPSDSPQTSQSEPFSSKTPTSPVQEHQPAAASSAASSPLSDPPQSPSRLSQASSGPRSRATRQDSPRHFIKSESGTPRRSPYRTVSRKSSEVGVPSSRDSNNANSRRTLPPLLNSDDEQDLGPSAQAFRYALLGFQVHPRY